MNAVHIRTQIDSDTLRSPELQQFVGKTVSVFIIESDPLPEPVKTPGKRQLGTDRGRVRIADDFDAPLDEAFQGAFDRGVEP